MSSRDGDAGRSDQSVSLYDFLERLWSARYRVASLTVCAAILGLMYVSVRTESYASEALLVPRADSAGPPLGAGLRGIASIAGLNLGSTENALVYALKHLQSRSFLESFVESEWPEFENVEALNDCRTSGGVDHTGDPLVQPDCVVRAYRGLVRGLEVLEVDDGGYSIRLTDPDPERAKRLLSLLLSDLDQHLRRRKAIEFSATLAQLRSAAQQEPILELRAFIYEAIKEQQVAQATALARAPLAWDVVQEPTLPYRSSDPAPLVVISLLVVLAFCAASLTLIVSIDYAHWKGARNDDKGAR